MATGRVPTTANSPLTAKGDLFTYSTAPARLAVGNNGEQIVADSSASTGLRYQTAYNGNAIINGGMDIWQRGTTFTTTSGVAYTVDRWASHTISAGGSVTTSRQTVSDTTNLPTIQYATKFQRVAANTNTGILSFFNTLESADSYRFAGQTATLSFYAKKGANYSAASSILVSNVASGTGTDEPLRSFTGLVDRTQNNTLTTTWQRFTYTGTIATNVTEMSPNIGYTPVGTAGANDYFEMTGVQMELGSVATNFSRTGGSFQLELAACQRYYVSLGAGDFYGSYYNASSQFVLSGRFPVTMRTTPTATLPSGTVTNAVQQVGVANYNASTFAAFAGATNSFSFTGTATGGTIYAPVAWLASDTTTFSAEL